MRASLEDRMRGASAGKTMYVVPYLMAAPGSPLDASPDDLETILTIDTQRWRQEIAHREQHLAQFSGLPEQIWQAHRRPSSVPSAGPTGPGQPVPAGAPHARSPS